MAKILIFIAASALCGSLTAITDFPCRRKSTCLLPRGRRSIAAVGAGARNPSVDYRHTMRESGFTGHHSGDPTGHCHGARLYGSYRDPTESIVATQALQAKSPSPLMPRLIRWQRSVRAVPSIFWGDRCTGASVAVAVSRPICALETSFRNFGRFCVESSSRPGSPVNPAGLVSQSTCALHSGTRINLRKVPFVLLCNRCGAPHE